MRNVVVLAIVLSAAVGLVSSDGAEPGQPPALPHTVPPPAVAASPVGWGYGPEYSHDRVTELRQAFLEMAKKRAEQMDGAELQQSIAEMRRQCLVAELISLGAESDDVRVGIAAMVLKAQDQKDVKRLLQSILKELEKEKPASE